MAEETHVTLKELLASNLAVSNATATLLIQKGHLSEKEFKERSEAERASYLAEINRQSVGDWSLSQEREFIENLLCQRFDFLLVFYSLIVAGAFQTQSQLNFALAFTVGALICIVFSISIFRTQKKLDLILDEIESIDEDHPFVRIENMSKTSKMPKSYWGIMKYLGVVKGSGRYIVGYCIPGLCSITLLAAAVFSWCEKLTIKNKLPSFTIPDVAWLSGWLPGFNIYIVLSIAIVLIIGVFAWWWFRRKV